MVVGRGVGVGGGVEGQSGEFLSISNHIKPF